MSRSRLLLTALVGASALSGCIVSKVDVARPDVALPDALPQAVPQTAPQTAPATATASTALPDPWWTVFGDATLDALMREALSNNTDVLAAAARVAEARANARIVGADRLPTVDIEGSATRAQESALATPIAGAGTPATVYGAQGTVAYELDLWGRYARASQAARARLLVSEYDRETVRLSLTGEVARGYFGLKAASQQLLRAQETLAARGESLDLERIRADAGETDEPTLRRSEAEAAAARTAVQQFQLEIEQRKHALGVLVGRTPRVLAAGDGFASEADLPAPPILPADMPSAVLQRRPDVRAADAELVAAAADIGAARAALFPRINLTGAFGWASPELSDLFTEPAEAWSLVGGVVQPLFQGGRLRAGVARAEAQRAQRQAEYVRSVQEAFRDVLDALRGQELLSGIRDTYQAQVTALARAAELSELRYDEGEIAYLDLLDVRRTLFQAQIALVGAERDALLNAVDLSLALGAGVGSSAEQPTR